MNEFMTVRETSERWVQTLCNNGKISGVKRFGKAWAILSNVEKPVDGRVTTGEYVNWRKNNAEER